MNNEIPIGDYNLRKDIDSTHLYGSIEISDENKSRSPISPDDESIINFKKEPPSQNVNEVKPEYQKEKNYRYDSVENSELYTPLECEKLAMGTETVGEQYDENVLDVSECNEASLENKYISDDNQKIIESPEVNPSTSRHTFNKNTNIESIPRYFHGIPQTSPKEMLLPKRKMFKEPMAFIIPFNNGKNTVTRKHWPQNSGKNNECSVEEGLEDYEDEPQLEAESSTELFDELIEFDNDIDGFDLDITHVIDDIIRLKTNENTEYTNSDETPTFSLPPEIVLHTIIELSEPDTIKPEECIFLSEPTNEDPDGNCVISTSNSWTSGSKETSYNSDDCLDKKSSIVFETNMNYDDNIKGGIYEYEKHNPIIHEKNPITSKHQSSPTLPSESFYEKELSKCYSSETKYSLAAYTIQRAFRHCRSINSKRNSKDHEALISPICLERNEEIDRTENSIVKCHNSEQSKLNQDHETQFFRKEEESVFEEIELPQISVNSMDAFVDDRSELLKSNAARILQKTFRAYREKKLQQNTIGNHNKQQMVDMDADEQNQNEVNFVKTPINVEHNGETLDWSKNNAALLIQQFFRSHKRKKIIHNKPEYSRREKEEKLIHSKDFIQSEFSGNDVVLITHGEVEPSFNQLQVECKNDLRLLEESKSNDFSNDNGDDKSLDWYENNAAKIIQKYFKVYMEKKLQQNNITEREIENSSEPLEVQYKNNATFLDASKNNTFANNKSTNKILQWSENHAANIIQKYFKVYMQRKLQQNNVLTDYEPIITKNNVFSQDKADDKKLDWSENIAASIIQKYFREYKAKKLKLNRFDNHNKTNIHSNFLQPEHHNKYYDIPENEAALIIQKAFRDYLCRNTKPGNVINMNMSQRSEHLFENSFEGSKLQHDLLKYSKSPNQKPNLNESSEQSQHFNEMLGINNSQISTEYNNTTNEVVDGNQSGVKEILITQKAFRTNRQKGTDIFDTSSAEETDISSRNDINARLINFVSAVSLEGNKCKSSRKSEERNAATKIQRAFRNFLKHNKVKETNIQIPLMNVNEQYIAKYNWYVGDEPIIANRPFERKMSETSFEETEAFVELVDNPPYVVDSTSRTSMDTNNHIDSNTVPSAQSSDSMVFNNQNDHKKLSQNILEIEDTEPIDLEFSSNKPLFSDELNKEQSNGMYLFTYY